MYFQFNLFFWLFGQLFDNMSPVVCLSYSQDTPNTWLASTEQFDLSPRVVIGDPGLAIHGPFDCWHVKCSVPLPKAESWCAGSFVFSCLTSDPRAITGSWYTFKQQQQQQQMQLVYLAPAWEMCVFPDLLLRFAKESLYEYFYDLCIFPWICVYVVFW